MSRVQYKVFQEKIGQCLIQLMNHALLFIGKPTVCDCYLPQSYKFRYVCLVLRLIKTIAYDLANVFIVGTAVSLNGTTLDFITHDIGRRNRRAGSITTQTFF